MRPFRISRYVVSLRAGIGIVFHSPWGWVHRPEHAALFKSEAAAEIAASRFSVQRQPRVVGV